MWWSIGVDEDFQSAMFWDGILRMMAAVDVCEAQRRAKLRLESNYRNCD
jgi:hypothetical protein